VRGQFTQYRGTILYDSKDVHRSQVVVLIYAKSIDTGNADRDRHLQSKDFFDVEQFPAILFRSERIEGSGSGFVLHGTLSMHGVTKSVAMPFQIVSLERPDQWGNRRIAFEAQMDLKRRDFGIEGPAFWSGLISDEVRVEISAAASIHNYDRWSFQSRAKPSIGEVLLRTAQENGSEAARKQFLDLRESQSGAYNFDPSEVLLAARRLAQAGRVKEGLSLIQILPEAYPQLANFPALHEELAKLTLKLGDREAAANHCRKALELDKDSTVAAVLLRHLGGS
jgi:polyisoprenoid-binding protein YceI